MAGRITQLVAESHITPDTQSARITQLVAEPHIIPTDQSARITQIVAESHITPTNQDARITQIVVEVWVTPTSYSGGMKKMGDRIIKKSENTVWVRSEAGFDPFEWGGACMRVEDITQPGRAVNPSYCQSADDGSPVITGTLRGLPALPTTSLVMKELQYDTLANALQSCWWTVDRRTHCKNLSDWNAWEKIKRVYGAAITERTDNGSSFDEDDVENLTTLGVTGQSTVTLQRVTATVDLTLETGLTPPATQFLCASTCHGDRCQTRCASENQCTIAIGTSLVAGGGAARSHILTNDHGGEHGYWTDISVSAFDADDVVDILCFNDWLLAVGEGTGLDPQFVLSYDKGVTQISITGNTDMTTGTHYVRAVDAMSPSHIVAVGLNGYCYVSDDGAITWSTTDAGVAATTAMFDVQICRTNPSYVYAIGASNAFIRSINGGYNWSALTGPSAGDDLTALCVIDENHLLVGNDDGELYETSDGGTTWTRQTITGDFVPATGVSFRIYNAGYDVFYMICRDVNATDDQLVYRNVDGGASGRWHLVTNGTLVGKAADSEPFDIAICGPNRVIVVGGEATGATSGFVAIVA